MKSFIKMLIAFCLFGYGPAILAQSTVASAGGDASGDGGSVSYTVGQIVYTTSSGPDGSVLQGVQQPYEIWIITGFDYTQNILLECVIFPNPTTHHVVLKLKNYDMENVSFHLFNINGKLLEHKKVVDHETTIQMDHLKPATYFLRIFKENEVVKTFKINKK